ncbi:Semaphorin-3C, partial [Clarias magur]
QDAISVIAGVVKLEMLEAKFLLSCLGTSFDLSTYLVPCTPGDEEMNMFVGSMVELARVVIPFEVLLPSKSKDMASPEDMVSLVKLKDGDEVDEPPKVDEILKTVDTELSGNPVPTISGDGVSLGILNIDGDLVMIPSVLGERLESGSLTSYVVVSLCSIILPFSSEEES